MSSHYLLDAPRTLKWNIELIYYGFGLFCCFIKDFNAVKRIPFLCCLQGFYDSKICLLSMKNTYFQRFAIRFLLFYWYIVFELFQCNEFVCIAHMKSLDNNKTEKQVEALYLK